MSEDHYYGRENEAARLVRSAGSEGTGTVMCSQGGVIPDLMQRLARQDGVALAEPVAAKKGSVWSLTFSDESLVAAEYFTPLA